MVIPVWDDGSSSQPVVGGWFFYCMSLDLFLNGRLVGGYWILLLIICHAWTNYNKDLLHLFHNQPLLNEDLLLLKFFTFADQFNENLVGVLWQSTPTTLTTWCLVLVTAKLQTGTNHYLITHLCTPLPIILHNYLKLITQQITHNVARSPINPYK